MNLVIYDWSEHLFSHLQACGFRIQPEVAKAVFKLGKKSPLAMRLFLAESKEEVEKAFQDYNLRGQYIPRLKSRAKLQLAS